MHFPESPGLQNDDRVCADYSHLYGREVVITEKMDGENTSMYHDRIHARSLDSNNHVSRSAAKALWGDIRMNIPENMKICGENMMAEHSIGYENLKSYFLVFNIWQDDKILDWGDTVEWCEMLDLEMVPVLYRGLFEKTTITDIVGRMDFEKQEGFVCRVADAFDIGDFHKNILKYVRGGHVQTEQHWMSKPMIKNKLA